MWWGARGQLLSRREAYISNLSLLPSLEPLEKFVVGGWWSKVSVMHIVPVTRLEGFRALKSSNLEGFRVLKPSNLEGFRAYRNTSSEVIKLNQFK